MRSCEKVSSWMQVSIWRLEVNILTMRCGVVFSHHTKDISGYRFYFLIYFLWLINLPVQATELSTSDLCIQDKLKRIRIRLEVWQKSNSYRRESCGWVIMIFLGVAFGVRKYIHPQSQEMVVTGMLLVCSLNPVLNRLPADWLKNNNNQPPCKPGTHLFTSLSLYHLRCSLSVL